MTRNNESVRRIDRRDFAKEAGLAFLSGVTVTIAACGGGGGGTPNPASGTPPTTLPPTAGPGDEMGDVSGNHGHSAVIKSAEVQAGAAIEISILGSAGHPHMVRLSAEAMRDIKENKPVEVRSSMNDGHEHLVTFNADIPSPPTRY